MITCKILDFQKWINEIGAKTDNIGREIDLMDHENSEFIEQYHNHVHLNYRTGTPFNHLMRNLLDTPDGLIWKTQKRHLTYANTITLWSLILQALTEYRRETIL